MSGTHPTIEEDTEHKITAKIYGQATLIDPPESPQGSMKWDDRLEGRHHFECSCGEQIGDTRQEVFSHLREVGALGE